jgi:hypothetical protein
MKLNGTCRLVAYANNVNIVGEHLYMIQKNTEALLDASKEVDLEVNPEKTYVCVCVWMSRCMKAGQRQIGPLKVWQSSNIWDQH